LDDLIEKAKLKDNDSFIKLVEGIIPQLYKTAYIQLKNEQDSLDVVQETLAKAYSKLTQLRHNEYFKTWLIRILLNECTDIQKYKSKIVQMDSMIIGNKKDSLNYTGIPHDISLFIQELDDMYKKIIDLRYNHDLKLLDISKILNIPLGTVKSRLNRAHEILRSKYFKEVEYNEV